MHLPPSFLLPCLHAPRIGLQRCARVYAASSSRSARNYAHAAVRDDFPEQTASEPPRHPQAGEYAFPKKKNPTPYEIMHLERTASAAEIKKRYYSLALLYHPDSTHPSSSSDNFTTLNKAYKLLSNDHARNMYNRAGVGWSAGPDSPANSGRGADPWNDEMMRAEIRRRGTHHWGSPNYGAGRGSSHYAQTRWGHAAPGYGAYGMGEHEMTGGKPIYTSNSRFVGAVFVLVSNFRIVERRIRWLTMPSRTECVVRLCTVQSGAVSHRDCSRGCRTAAHEVSWYLSGSKLAVDPVTGPQRLASLGGSSARGALVRASATRADQAYCTGSRGRSGVRSIVERDRRARLAGGGSVIESLIIASCEDSSFAGTAGGSATCLGCQIVARTF